MSSNPVETQPLESTAAASNLDTYSQVLSGLGAFGVALQNYPAVVLFLNSLTHGVLPASRGLDWAIQIAAVSTGGICSGTVNYMMNIELLNDFFKRMRSNKPYRYEQLNTWERLQYFGGILVFVVTGILFGLTAFTFAAEGALATFSIAAGVFVAGIMTVQELETWFLGWDEDQEIVVAAPLNQLQYFGKCIGHLIAIGNVLALSLLFTLSLAQTLMAFHIAALPALIAGAAIAFTFGAFTEYYFYNAYLSDFCKNFGDNLNKMLQASHAWFGILCIATNAFVNGALTYAGVELLTALLLTTHIAVLPPLAAFTVLAAVSAFFAGSASLILGLKFWTPKEKPSITSISMFEKAANDKDIIASKEEEEEEKVCTI